MVVECLSCPDFAQCRGGVAPVTRAGYWRIPWRDEVLPSAAPETADAGDTQQQQEKVLANRLQCLEPSACVGAADAAAAAPPTNGTAGFVEEGCAEFYSGPLCAACTRHAYKQAASYLCLPCYDAPGLSALFVALVVASALAVIVGMTLATVADGGEASAVDVVVAKIAWNSAVISAAAASFPLSWPPAVVSMFQVYAVASASAMGDSLSADCVVRTGSLRPAQAWALSMVVIPPVTVLLWVVAFSALAKCNRRHKFLQVHLPVATLVTLLMAHPVITKAALKLLACRPVAGRSFLEADMNVDCASDEYRVWSQSLGLPMLFAFTLGIPGCYALAMWRHVRRGRLAARRAVYGFLFSGFREDRWWFELWNTLRKSLFTMGAVVFGPFGTSMQTWAALVLLLLFVVVFSLSEPVSARVLNCVYVRPLFFRLYVQGSPPPHTPLSVCIVLCSTSTRG